MRFPVIEIEPVVVDHRAIALLQHPEKLHMLVFISVNAVRFGLPVIHQANLNINDLQVAAIGKATTGALEDSGVPVDIYPEAGGNSEALLALADMQDVAGKHILIIRGHGGREFLGEQLTERGARIAYLECYKRVLPDTNVDEIINKWHQGEISAVTATSVEGLNNLVQLLGDSAGTLLKQTPHVVISKRMYEYTQKMAISAPVVVADEASDKAIIEALINILGASETEVENE